MNARHLGRTLSVTLLLGMTVLTGAQTTSERLQQLQRDLQQQKNLNDQQAKQLKDLRARLENLTAQQKATLDRLDALAVSVADLENQLASATARVALAERQLDETTAQLALTQARVESLKADVRGVLNGLYRERSGQYLALMTQSRSLSDLLIRLDYANMSGQHNVQVINNLRSTAELLTAQQETQTRQSEQLKALQAERAAKLAALRAKRTEQQALLAQLRKSAEGQKAIAVRTQAQQALTAQSIDQLVGQVVKERARIEAERRRRLEEERKRREAEARRIAAEQERARQEAIRLAKLKAEQERKAREERERLARERAAEAARQRQLALEREQAALRARQQALERERAALRARQAQVQQAQQQATADLQPLPLTSSTGPVGFPLAGGQISAPYGANGAQWVLLSGPTGGQATAALEGNVLAATYYASLGWVVLLDNGNGIVTGYFGLSDASVSVGDRVNRGAPVGVIGGSPIFGADRMAFQLRQNGTPVAPRF